jgi:hypothetical protein
MRWEVQLQGNESGLEKLAQSFNDEPEIVQREAEDEFVLLTSQFDGVDDVEEVRKISDTIVRTIRAYGKRDSLKIEDLEAAGVAKITDDGTKQLFVSVTDTVAINSSATATVISADGEIETFQPADRTYEWTQLAMEDKKVSELAELIDKGDSWVNLYRVYEYIQDNIQSESNIVAQGWWSENEKNLFKRTANSRDAIGDDARHGTDQIPAPEDPMTHAEATRLVDTLVDRWLRHRESSTV